MAAPDRTATHALIEILQGEPCRFDFFQAMRLIECHYAERPRLGTTVRATDDPVRLGQVPELDFAPASLDSATITESGRLRLWVRFFGLFGPNGPLPLHLTEYARERLRHHGDPTFARFVDVFHHRMLCLFYRGWAEAQPTVSCDRPEEDRYAARVGALLGIGMDSLRDRDAMPDQAKLYFAGHLANQSRHPSGLCALIRVFFRVAIEIEEFIGEWLEIPERERTQLGVSPIMATLGVSTVLGARVWECQHKFRIVLGPMDLNQYLDLLPGERGLVELVAIVDNYLGHEPTWDAKLILRREEVPALRLDGRARLGWTTWLGMQPRRSDADDLKLNPFFVHAKNIRFERNGHTQQKRYI